MKIINMLKAALFDAIKNTFNFSGRTSRKGFWLYVLIHFIVLSVIFQIGRTTPLRFPGKIWLLCIILMGIPFPALFFRRLHDISSSKSSDAEICFALLVILLDFFLLDEALVIIRIIFLLYFIFKACSCSVHEINDYGPEPTSSLTTFSLSQKKSLFRKIRKLAEFVLFGSALLVLTLQHKEVADYFNELNLSRKIKESLSLKREIKVSSLFEVDYKSADVLLLSPYVRSKDIACPGYPEGLLEKIASQAPNNEGRYNLVVFNSSGFLASVKFTPQLCKKIPALKHGCLKFENAVFVHDKEENSNKNVYSCYKLTRN